MSYYKNVTLNMRNFKIHENYKTFKVDTYSNCVDEFLIGDVAITILVKRVVDTGQFLGCHENTQLADHFLKL
jgi:hypothetical protein